MTDVSSPWVERMAPSHSTKPLILDFVDNLPAPRLSKCHSLTKVMTITRQNQLLLPDSNKLLNDFFSVSYHLKCGEDAWCSDISWQCTQRLPEKIIQLQRPLHLYLCRSEFCDFCELTNRSTERTTEQPAERTIDRLNEDRNGWLFDWSKNERMNERQKTNDKRRTVNKERSTTNKRTKKRASERKNDRTNDLRMNERTNRRIRTERLTHF